MTQFRFEFQRYERRFRQPLKTNHGVWSIREGIILKLENSGRVGVGEIAPLPWFGSETIDDAISFCESLGSIVTINQIGEIPDRLPACQFGFESALSTPSIDKPIQHSALLASGQAWKTFWNQGYRTFKLKIGIDAIDKELATLNRLLDELPTDSQLRLDANAGLTESQTHRWLEACENRNVEFIEQPMPIDQFETMLKLSNQYRTAIALDESVATLAQLQNCYDRGWRGIFVIKPAIAGSPSRLRQFCKQHQLDTIFSTVFETAIGRQAGLNLAAELSDRAAGYGAQHWFDD